MLGNFGKEHEIYEGIAGRVKGLLAVIDPKLGGLGREISLNTGQE